MTCPVCNGDFSVEKLKELCDKDLDEQLCREHMLELWVLIK